jgi:hypothetical protein
LKIAVISDTHGLLRPEVLPALTGVSRILHLGDVGKISILRELEASAPVTAIRGNVDHSGPCSELPATEVVPIEDSKHGARYIYMLHDLNTLHLDPAAAKFAAVLYGHTHTPSITRKRGVLYFNPGSCGPRRFDLPVTIGLLTVSEDGKLEPAIIPLALA